MKVYVKDYVDNWQIVKNAAMWTIGKKDGKYPSSDWKSWILKAEHSPIRPLTLTLVFEDVPRYIMDELFRHHIGLEKFAATQREDRTGVKRESRTQMEPSDFTIVANAQALINISRKRLCGKADPGCRKVWTKVRDAVAKVEPELALAMNPECIYRGFCPEMKSCGYSVTPNYIEYRYDYERR